MYLKLTREVTLFGWRKIHQFNNTNKKKQQGNNSLHLSPWKRYSPVRAGNTWSLYILPSFILSLYFIFNPQQNASYCHRFFHILQSLSILQFRQGRNVNNYWVNELANSMKLKTLESPDYKNKIKWKLNSKTRKAEIHVIWIIPNSDFFSEGLKTTLSFPGTIRPPPLVFSGSNITVIWSKSIGPLSPPCF